MRYTAIAGVVFIGLLSCQTRDPKFQQYFVEGEQLYLNNCSNCHHKDGKGLGRIYPPIAGSDYLGRPEAEIICLIKYGIRGEIVVNGTMYHQPMPGVPLLTELEIAEITTYIFNTWGQERGMITIPKVSAALDSCRRN
ncbi:MAG TPA: cytochrome c [Cyclobacteriaceae bacterium]|nr:cytochrome c [Cyclobacteriaceae bacterium]